MCRDSRYFLRQPAKAPWLRVRLTVLSVAAEHSRTVPAFTRSLWREQPAGCCLQNGTGLLLHIPKSTASNLELPKPGYYYGVFNTSDRHYISDSITLFFGNEKRKIEFGSRLTGVTARVVFTPRMAPWVRRLSNGWVSVCKWQQTALATLKFSDIRWPSIRFPTWLKAIDKLFQPAWVTELLCLVVMAIVFAATTAYAG